MERLSDSAITIINELHTERLDYYSEYLPLINAAQRLYDYEGTGLEPEQVADMAENAETRLLTWFEAKYGVTAGELMGLIEAHRTGRAPIFPCKRGDHVWINGIIGGECEEHVITSVSYYSGEKPSMWFNADLVGYQGEARCSFGYDQFWKCVFTSPEAAREALGKEDD